MLCYVMQAGARGEAPRVAQELGIANFNDLQAKARGEAARVAQELGITKSLSHEMLIYQKNRILNFDVTSKTFDLNSFPSNSLQVFLDCGLFGLLSHKS